jgi:hypothetical protein
MATVRRSTIREGIMSDFQLWTEIITAFVSALISICVSYGVMKAKIHYMEEKLEKFDKDHDLLVEIKTKIDLLVINEPGKRSEK